MKKIFLMMILVLPQFCSAAPITLAFEFLENEYIGQQGHLILNGDVDFSGNHPAFSKISTGYLHSRSGVYAFGATSFHYESLQGSEWDSGYGIMHVSGKYIDSNGFERSVLAYCEGFENRLKAAGLLDAEGYFQFDNTQDFLPARLRLVATEPASYLMVLIGFLVVASRKYFKLRLL